MMGTMTRVQEWFPAQSVEALGDGDFRIEFLVHGVTRDGKRYYPKHVTEAAGKAGIFDGAKMYLNHGDPVADQRRGHRDLRDWGATIKAGSVQAVDGNLQAVCHAHTAEALAILGDPVAKAAVGLSHDSYVRLAPGKINGKQLHVVESIDRCNSVDFVPAGNANGRVLEAAPDEGDADMDVSTLTVAQLREGAPELVAEIVREAQEAQKSVEDKRITEAMAAIETMKAENAKLRESLARRDVETAVREAVGRFEGLTNSERAEATTKLLGMDLKLEDVDAKVAEAVKHEKELSAVRLREHGVRTQVTGAGPTDSDGQKNVREAHEAWYKAQCEKRGIPYTKLDE